MERVAMFSREGPATEVVPETQTTEHPCMDPSIANLTLTLFMGVLSSCESPVLTLFMGVLSAGTQSHCLSNIRPK
jgi:hypothetical protein